MNTSFFKKYIYRLLTIGLSAALTAGSVSPGLPSAKLLAHGQEETLSELQSESETEALSEPQSESETEALSESQSEPETEALSEPQSESETEPASESETEAHTEPAVITSLDQLALITDHPVIKIIRNDEEDRSLLMYAVYNLWNLSATAVFPDGTTESLTLGTEWRIGDYTAPQIDVSTVGTYTETGTILVPEGYVLAEDIPKEINIPVSVYIPKEPIPVISTETVYSRAYAFSSGTSMDEILSNIYLQQSFMCYAADGNSFRAPIYWDTGSVDPDVPGIYTITASIAAPEYTVFPETLVLPKPEVTISVQKENSPDINSCYYNYGHYTFPWITQSEEMLAGMTVWISADNGPWTQYTVEEDDVYCLEDGLYLPEDLITDGRSYRIQVDYEGGSTSIVSFRYSMSEDRVVTDVVGGDRDGGDSGRNDFDSTIQPPPKTGESGSAPHSADITEASKEFLEIFAEDYDLISGTRLHMTIDLSGTAQFSKHGITVTLDPETVDLWNIANSDRIRITIRQENDHAFVFSVNINDSSVKSAENTRIMIPWNSVAGQLSVLLLDQENVIQSLGVYDSISGSAAFSVDQTGCFTLYESVSVSAAVLMIQNQRMEFCTSLMHNLGLLAWMTACLPFYTV